MARIQRICKYRRNAATRQRIARMAAVWASGTRPGKGGGRDFQGFAQRQFSSANVG